MVGNTTASLIICYEPIAPPPSLVRVHSLFDCTPARYLHGKYRLRRCFLLLHFIGPVTSMQGLISLAPLLLTLFINVVILPFFRQSVNIFCKNYALFAVFSLSKPSHLFPARRIRKIVPRKHSSMHMAIQTPRIPRRGAR